MKPKRSKKCERRHERNARRAELLRRIAAQEHARAVADLYDDGGER